MSHLDLVDMIANLSQVPDMQLESTVFDFIVEHVKEADVCRFKDVASVLEWLHADYTFQHGQNHASTDTISDKSSGETTLEKILRPGAKITIPKPRPSDIKFNDMESLKAYLNKTTNDYQNFDDSEEVDVTTYDFTPPWNHYPIVEPVIQNRKKSSHIRVLTETQPKATANKSTNVNKMPKKCKPKDKGSLTDDMFQCSRCGRQYKRRINLVKHEEKHLQDNNLIEPIKNNSRKRRHNQMTNRIPLLAAEIISA